MSAPGIILLVEDEESVQNLVAELLETHNYRVLRARNGEEAVSILDGFPEPIHLLLTDIKMEPFMSGVELSRRLKSRLPGLKVLYISAYEPPDSIHEELQAGRCRYLKKPFTLDTFAETVQEMLEPAAPGVH